MLVYLQIIIVSNHFTQPLQTHKQTYIHIHTFTHTYTGAYKHKYTHTDPLIPTVPTHLSLVLEVVPSSYRRKTF